MITPSIPKLLKNFFTLYKNMYDHNTNTNIPYLFICIGLFAYTFTNTRALLAKII